jgi:prevent-host-death family protein
MRGHIRKTARPKEARKSVGVRELKAHAARILRQVRESRASYLVTHRGRPIGVILPVDDEDTAAPVSGAETTAAWTTFLQAGRRLERRFAPGRSGVRLLSESRR